MNSTMKDISDSEESDLLKIINSMLLSFMLIGIHGTQSNNMSKHLTSDENNFLTIKTKKQMNNDEISTLIRTLNDVSTNANNGDDVRKSAEKLIVTLISILQKEADEALSKN